MLVSVVRKNENEPQKEALFESQKEPKEISIIARKILHVLSNKDSLRIFELAAEGITAKTTTISKCDLTKKRYYIRLRQLVELGLVTKYEKIESNARKLTYGQTPFGRLVYREYVLRLEETLCMFLSPNSTELSIAEDKPSGEIDHERQAMTIRSA